ncbi:MAG: HD domain-containing protein [Terrisporobacter sp.]
MSDLITTFSKVSFNPLNPSKDDILIEDIAHSLSLITRANGHFSEFYSVAQHSIACCEEAIARGYNNKVILACLLHDASEAYISDIIRPVKRNLQGYLEVEKQLQSTIYEIFLGEAINEEEQKLIDSVDDTLLYHEFIHYMDKELPLNKEELRSKPEFKFVDFKEIEDKYKNLFYSFQDKITLKI